MGANITAIAYLRVLILEIGSTIILMVVEAQGSVNKQLGFLSSNVFFQLPVTNCRRSTGYSSNEYLGGGCYEGVVSLVHCTPSRWNKIYFWYFELHVWWFQPKVLVNSWLTSKTHALSWNTCLLFKANHLRSKKPVLKNGISTTCPSTG